MTAKEWLQSAPKLDRRIDRKIEQLERLKSLAERVTTTVSDMPRGTSPDPHRTENIMLNIVEMERDINADRERLFALKGDIRTAIESVPDGKLKKLLQCRYLSCMTWKQTSEEIGEPEPMTRIKIHSRALEKIYTICCGRP